MANYTSKLNLEKPLTSEKYDVTKVNANSEKIDAFATDVSAQLADIAGGTGLNDASIKPEKIYGVPNPNLFNKDAVTKGYAALDASGPILVAGWAVSDFIEILPSTQYVISSSQVNGIAYYDASKVWLATVSGTATNHVFTTRADAKYVRLNIASYDAKADTYMMIKANVMPSTYVPFGICIDWLSINEDNIKDGAVTSNKFGNGVITGEKMNGITPVPNLFNKATVKDGYANTGGTDVASPTYAVTDFIAVEPLTKYTVSDATTVVATYYDENKVYLSNLVANAAPYTLTTPLNTKFMKINIVKAKMPINSYMVVKGLALPAEYVPYGLTVDWLHIRNGSVNHDKFDSVLQFSQWLDKTLVTFGDSITWYDGKLFSSTHKESGILVKGYQAYIRERLGCTVNNQGVSGYDMTQINTVIQAFDYTGVNAVTITSGANDHRKGILPGTVLPIGSAFVTTTFAGALQASIEKIINTNSAIKIYLITPIRGWFTESGTANVPGPYNMEMSISDDYVNVMKAIGELYGIPVCDLYNHMGLNDLNKLTVLGDDPALFTAYLLHPLNIGFNRMQNVIVPFLNNN